MKLIRGDKWDKEVLGRILVHTAQIEDKEQYSMQYCAELQRKIRNGDLCLDEIYNDDILMVSMLMREYDGKVSRAIFHPELEGVREFAFFSDRQYDEMSEAAQFFAFTPGEPFIHGNKGIGHKMFNTIEGITQIDNSVMDAVRRASTVLVRTRTGRNRDLKKIAFHHGGFVDIGEAEFQQNLMGANLNSNVEVARYFRQKLEFNNNISGTNMANRDGKPQTLGEVRFQATKEARVQKNRIAFYYEQLDYLLRETVRKLLRSKSGYPGFKQAKIWKERCIARGVPEEFFDLNSSNVGLSGLPEHLEVSATRASGSGSQVADQIEMQTMISILPTLGERGRRAVLRDYVASIRGFRYIDRYLPLEDQTEQPTGDDSSASVENNQLEKGELVVVSPDNNHAVHAARHINRMRQIAQLFNQAEAQARQSGSETPSVDAGNFGRYSLEEVDIAFQTLGPHFTRHLLFLQQDPTRKDLATQLRAQWAVLANFGDKIANHAQEHREAEIRRIQKQQEEIANLPNEERVAMARVEMDARIKLAKLRADTARAAQSDQLKFVLERQKLSFQEEIERAKTINEIARDSAKAISDARRDDNVGVQDSGALF